jgi:TIR domain-containing protein
VLTNDGSPASQRRSHSSTSSPPAAEAQPPQPGDDGAATGAAAVFISYSHDNQQWRRGFTQMLAPMVRNRQLVLWDDTFIRVGDDWRRQIGEGTRQAGVALLLVSGSYLASPFLMREELPALSGAGVRLAPVLIEDCLWDQEPQLTGVQWAHDPRRDGPLAAADPREVPGRIAQVCRKLLNLVPALSPPGPGSGAVPRGDPS